VTAYFAQNDLSETKNGNAGGPAINAVAGNVKSRLRYNQQSICPKWKALHWEKYIIQCRLDKVKEWLVYSDETLTEIAYRTGYSSVQHLSNQFRQQTGLTPSHFRQLRRQKQALQQG